MNDNDNTRPDGWFRQPPRTMTRIEHVYAFLGFDPVDQNEGVAATFVPGTGWLPLVAADEKRLNQITIIAEHIAAETGQAITLVKFSTREDIRVIGKKQ